MVHSGEVINVFINPLRSRAGRWAVVAVLALTATCAPAGARFCGGDSDGDGRVSVAELVTGVGVALGLRPVEDASGFDLDVDGAVSVSELVTAVRSSLEGCPKWVIDIGRAEGFPGSTVRIGTTMDPVWSAQFSYHLHFDLLTRVSECSGGGAEVTFPTPTSAQVSDAFFAVQCSVKISESARPGVYPLSCSNQRATGREGDLDGVVCRTGTIRVLSPDSDGDGLTDQEEELLGTDPHESDSDRDNLDDGWEARNGLDPLDSAEAQGGSGDPDGDGLGNSGERDAGTDPLDSDTDDDQLFDGAEIGVDTDPLNPDSDGDGVFDGDEVTLYETDPLHGDSDRDGLGDAAEIEIGTNPLSVDSDADELPDGWERDHGLDPLDPSGADGASGDPDHDQLKNLDELDAGTLPRTRDSDSDELDDGEEVDLGTNPLDPDTDGDALSDGDEVEVYGTDPRFSDSDRDDASDGDEVLAGTDPLRTDTDQDQLIDGWELLHRLDPLDSTGENGPLGDPDKDDLDNLTEQALGTAPRSRDTDFDRLDDGFEIAVTNTDPLESDTDDDGSPDGEEVSVFFTDPNNPDTDGGGRSDGAEIWDDWTNPLDPSDDVLACGDGDLQSGEECDDANNVGGDGCAANCTDERLLPFVLGDGSDAIVQTESLQIALDLGGQLVFAVGSGRPEEVQLANPKQVLTAAGVEIEVLPPGSVPVTIPVDTIAFDPIDVPGIACVCLGGGAMFRSENAGAGFLGCSPGGLSETDYLLTRADSNEQFSFSGDAPSGSALLSLHSRLDILVGADCSIGDRHPSKGPDGIPCTSDDQAVTVFKTTLLTTGRAEGRIVEANGGSEPIVDDGDCGDGECLTHASGVLFDCDLLEADTAAPFTGSVLAGASTSNAVGFGDFVLTLELVGD